MGERAGQCRAVEAPTDDLQGCSRGSALPRARHVRAGLGADPAPQVRLDDLITTKRELRLDALLDEASTFYGDLFPHAVQWQGQLYLEDGLHRALRSALQQRTVLHVRVLDLDARSAAETLPPTASAVDQVNRPG